MATVTGLTAARMLAMENDLNARSLQVEGESIVSARLVGYDLVLTTFAGVDINVGDVRGPTGPSMFDASLLTAGTLADARLPVTSSAAGIATAVAGYALRLVRTGRDVNGIFTTVNFYRVGGNTNLYSRSVLSGGASPLYTTRTLTEYALDGTTVFRTSVFTLAYDVNGDLTTET